MSKPTRKFVAFSKKDTHPHTGFTEGVILTMEDLFKKADGAFISDDWIDDSDVEIYELTPATRVKLERTCSIAVKPIK